ncbi:BTB/POZ domain-containing protein At5g66560-like [Tasmannia lanceolata]|uniref:BTB/POZ domain-containing protein At5g66560-like n=1 Tax=Tasmannia lanceolata TaxID=3420 RepID=UPI0040631D37
METEKLSSRGQAWFCTTGLPSDIIIEVEQMTFHLHKFPLMSKSRKLYQLITEHEANPRKQRRSSAAAETEEVEEEKEEITEEEPCYISLSEFPGGSETFETAAKFCYGVKIDLTPWNIAPLLCAGEYLEMTENFSEENLIPKVENFLTKSVLKTPKDTIKTLKSCEQLMPLAESLFIPQRCIDSIAAKASSSDPSLFSWPVNDGITDPRPSNPILWNGIDTGISRKNQIRSSDTWLEDLSILSLNFYKRLISAMRARDLSPEIIEGSLISYAKRSIPGLSRSNRKQVSSGSINSESEQLELVETVITNLPSISSSSATTTRFLFGLLRTANILHASEGIKIDLERKIASQLEQATLDELLMPSYSYLIETLYDVECVERILGFFLEGLEERSEGEDRSPAINPVMMVGKLIDGYLSEIASDGNLKPEQFFDLAVALPDHARVFDDGLYRAVDVYLKAHPWIGEGEREKVCYVMDCQKLTLEACTHAAQNERLPLRTVVQVLFFEQLQLRHAIAGSLLAAERGGVPLVGVGMGDDVVAFRENQVLRLDMDSMRSRVHELERECSTMRKAIEKIDKTGSEKGIGGGGGGGWGWSLFTKKIGCKFRTQVCDSHERTVVESKKGRQQQAL